MSQFFTLSLPWSTRHEPDRRIYTTLAVAAFLGSDRSPLRGFKSSGWMELDASLVSHPTTRFEAAALSPTSDTTIIKEIIYLAAGAFRPGFLSGVATALVIYSPTPGPGSPPHLDIPHPTPPLPPRLGQCLPIAAKRVCGVMVFPNGQCVTCGPVRPAGCFI